MVKTYTNLHQSGSRVAVPIQFCTVAPTSFGVDSKFYKNHAPPVKAMDNPMMFRQQPFV